MERGPAIPATQGAPFRLVLRFRSYNQELLLLFTLLALRIDCARDSGEGRSNPCEHKGGLQNLLQEGLDDQRLLLLFTLLAL